MILAVSLNQTPPHHLAQSMLVEDGHNTCASWGAALDANLVLGASKEGYLFTNIISLVFITHTLCPFTCCPANRPATRFQLQAAQKGPGGVAVKMGSAVSGQAVLPKAAVTNVSGDRCSPQLHKLSLNALA